MGVYRAHRYKVLVVGNHDVLLDETFLENYPKREHGETKTIRDLDWGSVHYLRDSSSKENVTRSLHLRNVFLASGMEFERKSRFCDPGCI